MMEWIVVKTFLSLAAVLALMIGVVFVMKKYMFGGKASSSALVDMQVIGTMMLQPKRSVTVLKVLNKVLILGVTESGMQSLAEITDEQSLREIADRLAVQPGQIKWFSKKSESTPSMSFAEALNIQFNKVIRKES